MLAAALTAPLSAQSPVARPILLDLPAGHLSDALNSLARQAGLEIIFSPRTVGGFSNSKLRGRLDAAAAIALLLRGTRLSFRRTSEGGYVIVDVETQNAVSEPQLPEILVIGKRSQNTDIPRTRNDVQPYRVLGQRDIEASHAGTVDEFLRTRMPSDAQRLSAGQDPVGQTGSGRSEVDLHGLGSGETLVLVDGLRLPSVPDVKGLLLQPDINGLPVTAIDRLEVLTATSGGIYGSGATGGVLNVVLRRDYRGADLATGFGTSDRGDALTRRVSGRLGFTPDGGRTEVEVTVGATRRDPLAQGQRDLTVRGRNRLTTNAPEDYLAMQQPEKHIVITSTGGDLRFDDQAGGRQLGSAMAFLPIGTDGASPVTVTTDRARAPVSLADDASGSDRTLVSANSTRSLLLNVRHRFGPHLEAFVDLLALENAGSATYSINIQGMFLEAGAPGNPFAQDVDVTYPAPGLGSRLGSRLATRRLTSGLIADLPLGWRAEAHVALGEARYTYWRDETYPGASGFSLGPLGDWGAFLDNLQASRIRLQENGTARNSLLDASLKLAGSLLTLPGGPATLSLLGESRREHISRSSYAFRSSDGVTPDVRADDVTPDVSQRVRSAYAELRAPLGPDVDGFAPWRKLEVQLAARYDDVLTTRTALIDESTRTPLDDQDATTTTDRLNQRGWMFTAGIKTEPIPHVMLRTSYATGKLPASTSQIASFTYTVDYPGRPDPRRGGEPIGSVAPYRLTLGGSTGLRPETARTWAMGVVFNPEGGRRLRLSVDYLRIRKVNEISGAAVNDPAFFLANEARYGDHVERAPPTAADLAAGYDAGVVRRIETGYLNIGRTALDVVDIDANYTTSLPIGGSLRTYALATWEPRLRRRSSPVGRWIDYAGFANGPVKWRGNAGFEWRRGRVSLGANGQFYDGYRVLDADDQPFGDDLTLRYQGSDRIPAQLYLDLYAGWRLPMPSGRALELGIALFNITDHAPPLVVNPYQAGYSTYGDARGRRFEITAALRL